MEKQGVSHNLSVSDVQGSVYSKYILIYIQKDATLHSLFISGKLLYMFRVVLPPIIRSTHDCIYSIWHLSNRIATCRYRRVVGNFSSTHHQEHIQLYLQYLALVKPLLLPAAIVEELELTSTRCCRYSCVCS